MQLRENHSLPVPLVEAWDALNDLALLRESIPGCESLDEIADDTFDAVMAMPVGPMTTRFTTRILRREVAAPHRCTLHFEAVTMAASGTGSAAMRLSDDGTAGTTLQVDIDVRIEGVIAQLGSSLVDLATRRMADEFFARFRSGVIARRAEAATR